MPVDPVAPPASPAPRSPDACGAPPAPLPALEQALAGLALAGEASCERRARRAADEWAAREQCGRNSGALAELRITWSAGAGECAEAAGEGGEPLPRLPAMSDRGLADVSVSASAADGVGAMCSSNAAAEDALSLADLPSAALPAAVRDEAVIALPGVRAARTFHAAAAAAATAVAAPDESLGDGGGESDDDDGAGGFDVQLVRRDARLRNLFEAELEQLNAARERRRHEERSWRAQEESRQQTLNAQTQRLREALALALDRAAAHADFVAAEHERRRREARALWVRGLSALQQRQAAAYAQACAQQRAGAAEAVAAGAIDASTSAAAPLAEQVRQARLSECRCFAGGADGHVPGCVGGAPVEAKDAGAGLGVGAGAAALLLVEGAGAAGAGAGAAVFPLAAGLRDAAAGLAPLGFASGAAEDAAAAAAADPEEASVRARLADSAKAGAFALAEKAEEEAAATSGGAAFASDELRFILPLEASRVAAAVAGEPASVGVLDAIFNAMSECAQLHPDGGEVEGAGEGEDDGGKGLMAAVMSGATGFVGGADGGALTAQQAKTPGARYEAMLGAGGVGGAGGGQFDDADEGVNGCS